MIKWNEVTWYSKLAAAIFLIVVLPLWMFYLGVQYQKTVESKRLIEIVHDTETSHDEVEVTISKIEEWTIFPSTRRGYPFSIENKDRTASTLYVYGIDDKKLLTLDTTTALYGGSVGAGETSPVPSPDFRYTAYSDKSGDIFLASNDGLNKKKILSAGSGSNPGIIAWSPDGKMILLGEMEGSFMGLIPKAYAAEIEPEQKRTYYLFNVEEGILSTFSYKPIDTFIDSDHLVTYGRKFTVLNIHIFKKDTSFDEHLSRIDVSSEYADITPHYFPFVPNAVVYDVHKGDTGSIVYADFVSGTTTIVDAGAFARFQQPRISPQGKKIAYSEVDSARSWVSSTWIYDTQTKQKRNHGNGKPVDWIDENQLVIRNDFESDNDFQSEYCILELNANTCSKISP